MKFHLICISHKAPSWVQAGFEEYQKRLNQEVSLKLIEIPALKRAKNLSVPDIKSLEAEKLLNAAPKQCYKIALDVLGKQQTTEHMAQKIQSLQMTEPNVALFIGGPDGLCPNLLQQCDAKWSLSKLTFPHHLVKILLAEQLYRSWSILNNHPYHKA
jgi:23S rRNA (pseudouridine1915-N3)-methyltransferase